MGTSNTAEFFIADVHLGKLARLLRLSGFDTEYQPTFKKEDILRIALRDGRAVLTRDQALLRRAGNGFLLSSDEPKEQCVDILTAASLADRMAPFSRCLCCNGLLREVDKASVASTVPPAVFEWQEIFYRCSGCDRVYWKGTHYERLKVVADTLRDAAQIELSGG